MAISKVLLFYAFAPIPDPEAIRLWQRDLCESLNLRGRILISRDGFNGTVGGELNAMKIYRRKTREYPAFKDIDFKWSEGSGLDASGASLDFPRLSVKVRDEVVSFGVPDEVEVDEHGVIGGGEHLKPEELHELIEERGKDVVFFDGRNAWEARIGHFANAVVPDVRTSKDFIAELESGKYDALKDKPVVTYCTGGIRCELLSAMMKKRGFSEVYQMDGGIVRYGEKYGNDGYWEGSLAIFDGREVMDFGINPKVLSTCDSCGMPTARLANCTEPTCRKRLLCCEECETVSCPEHAHESTPK